ncbi:uncharacterized protein AKAME5_002389400 [Lates japonicus]|uniref:Uncharacterized protein n=1 Tax=Lates japonicus TaxID=270547 RepID=A0AAD3RJA9_LATJO|nr:uncharacterized protein AKAME5_002389400 [Lates japonicus]
MRTNILPSAEWALFRPDVLVPALNKGPSLYKAALTESCPQVSSTVTWRAAQEDSDTRTGSEAEGVALLLRLTFSRHPDNMKTPSVSLLLVSFWSSVTSLTLSNPCPQCPLSSVRPLSLTDL